LSFKQVKQGKQSETEVKLSTEKETPLSDKERAFKMETAKSVDGALDAKMTYTAHKESPLSTNQDIHLQADLTREPLTLQEKLTKATKKMLINQTLAQGTKFETPETTEKVIPDTMLGADSDDEAETAVASTSVALPDVMPGADSDEEDSEAVRPTDDLLGADSGDEQADEVPD
jgi:hypothetical protein